ncbi:MAG: class I SAM-dependent methyltransferase, partial [Acidimicrobiia bacterium]
MASETSAAEIVAESDGPLESPPDPSVEPSYGAYYYAHDCGIPYERNEHWLGFFDEVARGLIRELRPQSTLDAGCAFGMLVEALRNHGVDASGIDLSSYAISQAPPELAPHLRVGTLTDPLPGRYDLITCVEVIEHLDPADAARALDNLTAATDRLLLCSTPTDYAEPTHVYVRQPEEWAADLAKRGFVRDLSFDGSFLTPWTLLFVRSTLSPVDVVRTYEREHWRMKHEVGEVREAIIALH